MSHTITSLERVETVLAGGIPDRVPTDLHNFMMTAHASGIPFPQFFSNGVAMAEGQIRAWREFGHDVLILENGTAALAEACGCQVEYMTETAPVSHGAAIQSLDDLDKLVVPDPYKVHPLTENLKTTRIVAQELGNQAFIIARADQGPFSLAAMILGMDVFLFQLALSQRGQAGQGGRRRRDGADAYEADADLGKKLHRLLEFCLEVCTRYAHAQMEQGAHMTSIGESLSGPDVCSPRTYKEYEWGYARRLVQGLKQDGIRLAYHICGNATAIVNDMVDTGASVLELDYKCDLPTIKQATQGKTTILGVIDPSEVLARGTPDLVRETTRRTLEVLAPGGGLILGPGCALPPRTPPENVHAMIETAHRYGRY